MKKYLITVLFLLLAGCGGGGSGGSSSSTPTTPSTPTPLANTVPITVDGTFGAINRPYVSVTICAPGSSTCTTVDHVLVDTGSVGLRLLSTPAITALGLQSQATTAGNQLAECYYFASSYTWGTVKVADVKMAGETASSTSVQIVADASLPAVPNSCLSTGSTAQNTTAAIGANGILGVGATVYDCGAGCAATTNTANYYFTCTSSTCTNVAEPQAQQVGNVPALFSADNNGVLVQMPTISNSGAPSASGTLTFGIGTQSDNALGSAQVYSTDNNGYFTTAYKGTTYPDSFLDTGSEVFYFQDNSLPQCAASAQIFYYCPASITALSAVNTGGNGTAGTVDFNIENANTVLGDSNYAANDIGFALSALSSSDEFVTSFDWGLPFFYGRSVYLAFSGRTTPGGTGPYYAY